MNLDLGGRIWIATKGRTRSRDSFCSLKIHLEALQLLDLGTVEHGISDLGMGRGHINILDTGYFGAP